MLRNHLRVNKNNEGLAVSSGKISPLNQWAYPDKYYVKTFGKTQALSWNTSLSLHVISNNLLEEFQYLPLVKRSIILDNRGRHNCF